MEERTSPDNSLEYWTQKGWIASKDCNSYVNITLLATGYTTDNQVIDTDKVFVPTMSNQYQSTAFEAKLKLIKVWSWIYHYTSFKCYTCIISIQSKLILK